MTTDNLVEVPEIFAPGIPSNWLEYSIPGICLYFSVILKKNIGIGSITEVERDQNKQEFLDAYTALPEYYKRTHQIVVNCKDLIAFGEWLEPVNGKRRYKVSHRVFFKHFAGAPCKFRGLKLWLIFLKGMRDFKRIEDVIACSRNCQEEGAYKFGQTIITAPEKRTAGFLSE